MLLRCNHLDAESYLRLLDGFYSDDPDIIITQLYIDNWLKRIKDKINVLERFEEIDDYSPEYLFISRLMDEIGITSINEIHISSIRNSQCEIDNHVLIFPLLYLEVDDE